MSIVETSVAKCKKELTHLATQKNFTKIGLEKHAKKEWINKEFHFSVKLISLVYSVLLGVGQNILQIVKCLVKAFIA